MAKLNKEALEAIKFTNLHTYTHFSIPMGVGNVKAHIKRAAEAGFTGFAITDQYSMAGVLDAIKNLKDKDFLKKLGKEKFPLIIGCRLNVIDDLESRDRVNKYFSITVYAMNATGYKNLVTLCSKASREDHFYVRPRISLAELIEYQEGLVVTSGDLNGMIAQAILKETGQEELLMEIFKQNFEDRFYMEIHPYNLQEQWDKESKTYKAQEIDPQKIVNLKFLELAKRHKVKCFITQNAYMPKKSDKTLQDILVGNHPYGKDGWRLNHAYCVMTVPEMYDLVQKQSPYISDEQFLELCANTQEIQSKCADVKLIFSPQLPVIQYETSPVNQDPKWDLMMEETKKVLVDDRLKVLFDVAKEDISLSTSLKIMIKNGKIDFKDPAIQDRLATELEVIQRNGIINLCDYFLLLEDVTHFVRENGYLRGFGRGCLSGDSLVLTTEGLKKLREIKAGDEVYTHTGESKKVIKTFEYEIQESLLEVITQNSLGSEMLTKDHKVFGVKRSVLRSNKNYKQLAPFNHKPEFSPIESFKEGDLLFLKRPKYVPVEIEDLDLGLEAKESKFKVQQKEVVMKRPFSRSELTRFNRYIPWDESGLFVLGRFISAGWIEFDSNKKPMGIAFGFEAGEREVINKIISFFEELGMEMVEKRSTKTGQIKLSLENRLVARSLVNLFPEHKQKGSTKYIGKFKKLEPKLLKSFLMGLFSSESGELVTSSERLMLEVRESLMNLGLPSKVSTKKAIHRKGLDRSTQYVVKFMDLEEIDSKMVKDDGYYVRIQTMNEVPGQKVYDLMIEDNPSYVTSNYTVHNSGAGSLVAYALDITDCDPLNFNLLFERFLTKERIGKFNFELPGYPINEVLKKAKKP